jgi:mRNA interferase MazF
MRMVWLFFQQTGMTTMVTSATNKLSLDHDCPIREWEAAGLDKPSIARLDRIAEIPPGYLGTAGRIGRLVAV